MPIFDKHYCNITGSLNKMASFLIEYAIVVFPIVSPLTPSIAQTGYQEHKSFAFYNNNNNNNNNNKTQVMSEEIILQIMAKPEKLGGLG